MKAVYIIGTDTDVGKTLICAGLCWALKEKGYNIGYFKPVLSGAKRRGKMLIPQDTEFVVNFAKIKGIFTDSHHLYLRNQPPLI